MFRSRDYLDCHMTITARNCAVILRAIGSVLLPIFARVRFKQMEFSVVGNPSIVPQLSPSIAQRIYKGGYLVLGYVGVGGVELSSV